jgi:hypothetical protein
MEAVMRSALLLALLMLPLSALADDARGLWRETGYMEDDTGKRTPCVAEFCGALPGAGPSNLNALCAAAVDLQGFAQEQLKQAAMLFRSRMHNCKDTGGATSCDEGSMTSTIAPGDATHVAFSYVMEGGGHRMTRVWRYERLGDDCTGANGALHQRP